MVLLLVGWSRCDIHASSVNSIFIKCFKMNVVLWTFSRLRGTAHASRLLTGDLAGTGASHLRLFSSWILSSTAGKPQTSRLPMSLSSQAEGSEVLQQLPWQYQQVRTRKRGTEYQPKNIKRKRTHGWIKRISSQGGIEVILRRMLKGRKSLTH